MITRPFGNTGLSCSALGFGAGHAGSPLTTEDEASALLNAALDCGITLVDTAPGYGLAEERIGRHLAHRRGDFVLVSKCGYGVPGIPDWTPECIRLGVEQALRRMRTDVIDVMVFHSCPAATLDTPGLVEALVRCVEAGKVRVAGYSGENENLDRAMREAGLRAFETSVSLFDQRGLWRALPTLRRRGAGVIAKRPIGNAPWRFRDCPRGDYAEPYWWRMKAMGLQPPEGMAWDEYALRFTLSHEGIATAIVGTSRIGNLRRNAEIASRGGLPAEVVETAMAAFVAHHQWDGQV
jgi:aryl-alcohol dehydrogenase-like predicted oxidoreductase